MYPYNRNTQLQSATLEIKENTKTKEAPKKTSNIPIAEDRRFLEILTLAEMETAHMAQRYNTLMEDKTLAPSKDVLRAMYLDELKHLKLLQESRYLITGAPQVSTVTGKVPEARGTELLEDTLLLEMDNGDFFRTLYLSLPTPELRDIFFEIASAKQSHCTGLCYLFSKYFS